MRADFVRAKRLMAAGPTGDAGPSQLHDGRRPRTTRELAGRSGARLCRPGDVVLLVGRPRRRQDGLRPGLRRRARRGGPGDQPDLRAGAPLPLRRRAARSAPSSTPTSTAPARWTRSPTWPWPSWSRRTPSPSSSGATWPRRRWARARSRWPSPSPDPVGAPERRGRHDRRAGALGRTGPTRWRRSLEPRAPGGGRRERRVVPPAPRAPAIVAIETATETVGVAVRTPDGVRGRVHADRPPPPRRDADARPRAPAGPGRPGARPTSALVAVDVGPASSPGCGSASPRPRAWPSRSASGVSPPPAWTS